AKGRLVIVADIEEGFGGLEGFVARGVSDLCEDQSGYFNRFEI
ncbi:MAG: putative methyltransferase, partial [Akkermansiaceae bacterium]